MERIIRYRCTQPLTLDDFIEEVLNKPCCTYCQYLDDCTENMGCDTIEAIGYNGCSAFDNTITGLKEIYLKKYCNTPSTTLGT